MACVAGADQNLAFSWAGFAVEGRRPVVTTGGGKEEQ